MPRSFLSLAAVLFCGCTAVNGYVHLTAADQALGRADEQNAKEFAPYEYTMAVRYVEKAREEAGYSNWKDAETLAKAAAEWADKSIILIQTEGRNVPKPEDSGPPPIIPQVPPPVPDLPPGGVLVPPSTTPSTPAPTTAAPAIPAPTTPAPATPGGTP